MNTDTQTTTPVILAKDLVKTYGNVHALKGMNLRVDSGEIVAFTKFHMTIVMRQPMRVKFSMEG